VRARVVHPQPGSHLPFNLIIEIGLNAEEEPPPPPVDTGPELVAGFVEFLELDVSGTGTLQLRSLNQIALQPGIEFDPSTVEPGTPLTLGLCWASTGEAETFRVIVGGGEFEAGLPTLDAEFGGFETLPDGRLAINIAEVDLAVPPQALVTLPESTEAVPFSSVSIDAVLGHRVELWLVDELVEEVVVFPLEEDPALMDPYWDLLFTVYTADSTTWTLYGENPRFTADTQTVWEDGVSGIVDPLTVAEGTPLVFQVDAAGRVVRVELLQSDVDPIHLFEDPKLEVWEGNFIDLVAGVFRTSEIFPTPVASDLVVLDELTGDDLTQGGLAQVADFVRARALHPPLGSLLPDGLIVEIGLNAAEPVDFIDHRGGVVSFVELDGSGARGQLHLAAIKPVLLNSETGFQDAAGSSFDPAALELDEELGVVAWWTSAGDPLAVTVFRGGLPLGLSGFEMPFNGIQDLEDGTQALLAGQIEFDVSADAIIAIGDAELSLTDAVTLGELAVGSEVDLWLTESAAGEVQVTEVQVLANTLPAAEVEPFWDVFGTVYQVNEEICTLVLLNDPFTVDDATLYEDELGGVLASTDLLPGVALVIQVAFETDRVVRAQIEQEGADYSHLFDDPEVGVVFGNFLGFVDDLLLTSDPYQPSVAVDALIVNEETGEDVTATVGLSGLSGEFVRARILHPPPELVIPVDLVVQFGVNVVFDDLEDPVDPTAESPNANALLSLDLDPNLADQGLVHLQASAGGTIQLAIYASEVIDVTGMSVDVSYDPAQLAFEGASREAAGDANVLASSAIFLAPRVGEGTIKYTGIVLGDGGTATGELRSGLLAVLEFTPLDLSRADLVLERVVLNSAEGTDTLEPGLVARVVRLATGIADFNGDGFVEWNDLFRFADAWLDDDFDPIFDLNGDGSLDELDLFIFAPQWGRQVDVVAKVLARPELPQQGELQLEITSIDDEAVELLLSVDEARVLGYGASVRFDANAFRLKAINDVRPEAVSADRQTLLSLQRPGEVLFVGGSLSSAGVQGALARFEFERLSPEATGSFQIADAALRSSDGTTVRPLRSSGAEIRSLPQAFSLDRNYPNPFNPSTTIPYRLASASTVELEIFDIAGRKVRTVLAEIQEAGFRETTWDGRDEDGHVVGAGVYFYRLTALPTLNGDDGNGEFVEVRKLMLLK
jgi:hypothetical protein